MPAYTVFCPNCHHKDVIYARVADRDDPRQCNGCKWEFVYRIIEAPFVRGEIEPYFSDSTGRMVNSRAQRREDLKAARAYEWEPGIERDVARKKQYNLDASNAEIGKAVDEVVRDMNMSGKLENLNA